MFGRQILSEGVPQVSWVVLADNGLLMVASHVVPFHSCKYNRKHLLMVVIMMMIIIMHDGDNDEDHEDHEDDEDTVSIEVVEDGHASFVALSRVGLCSPAPDH